MDQSWGKAGCGDEAGWGGEAWMTCAVHRTGRAVGQAAALGTEPNAQGSVGETGERPPPRFRALAHPQGDIAMGELEPNDSRNVTGTAVTPDGRWTGQAGRDPNLSAEQLQGQN